MLARRARTCEDGDGDRLDHHAAARKGVAAVVARPRRAPGRSGRSDKPCDTRLAPGARAFAPMREEARGRRSCSMPRRARRARRSDQPLARDRPQVDRRARRIGARAGVGLIGGGAGRSAACTSGRPRSSTAGAGADDRRDASPRRRARAARARPPRARPRRVRASRRALSPRRRGLPSATGRQSAVSAIAPMPRPRWRDRQLRPGPRRFAVGRGEVGGSGYAGRSCRAPGTRVRRRSPSRLRKRSRAWWPCSWSRPPTEERLPSARVVNSARAPPGSSKHRRAASGFSGA